jgi:DNA-binding response OmpR family regulator
MFVHNQAPSPLMNKVKVFYIEDELSLGKIVCDTLINQGYEVTWESNGSKVMLHFERFTPDICILDIMLPGIDGYSLCRTIRGMFPSLPVIFLTAKTETADLVKGFESGGTDYIKKPFSIEELMVRIENQLRLLRYNHSEIELPDEIRIGKHILHPGKYELISPDKTIKLSNKDMQIIRLLIANRNKVTLRKDLLMSVWGDDSYFNSRTLDVYIRKIRAFLEPDPGVKIITLKGNGYLFIDP